MGEKNDTLYWAAKIGGRLRVRRKHLGLSLEGLSRLSGSAVPTLSNIERGKRDVKLSTLVSLSSALRIDLSALLADVDEHAESARPAHSPGGYELDDD